MLQKAKKFTVWLFVFTWITWFSYHVIDVNWTNKHGFKLGLVERTLFSAKYWFYHWRLKVDTYVMTQSQVSELFKNNPNGVPEHWDPKTGPTNEPLYAVVRVQNNTTADLFGTLFCKLPTGEKYLLEMRPANGYKGTFINSVIPIPHEPNELKKIGANSYTRWKYLYLN